MFFKKRREAKKAAEAEVRQNIVDSFAERVEAAGKLPDPGERILKLQEVANDVDDVVAVLAGDATKAAQVKQKLMFWTAMPAGIVVSAVYPPALIGLLGMGASVYGGKKLSQKFAERAEKKALDKERPFVDALEAQKTRALAAQDELVIKDAPGIATSPHFSDLIAKVPRMREQFAAAYARKITEEKAVEKPVPGSRRRVDDDIFKP